MQDGGNLVVDVSEIDGVAGVTVLQYEVCQPPRTQTVALL
jgi:hypothetical protein